MQILNFNVENSKEIIIKEISNMNKKVNSKSTKNNNNVNDNEMMIGENKIICGKVVLESGDPYELLCAMIRLGNCVVKMPDSNEYGLDIQQAEDMLNANYPDEAREVTSEDLESARPIFEVLSEEIQSGSCDDLAFLIINTIFDNEYLIVKSDHDDYKTFEHAIIKNLAGRISHKHLIELAQLYYRKQEKRWSF